MAPPQFQIDNTTNLRYIGYFIVWYPNIQAICKKGEALHGDNRRETKVITQEAQVRQAVQRVR